jgi:hypothetical protein
MNIWYTCLTSDLTTKKVCMYIFHYSNFINFKENGVSCMRDWVILSALLQNGVKKCQNAFCVTN